MVTTVPSGKSSKRPVLDTKELNRILEQLRNEPNMLPESRSKTPSKRGRSQSQGRATQAK